MIQLVTGDLTVLPFDIILHQTNTVIRGQNKAAGFAKVLFQRFPYCNFYRDPNACSVPGNIVVRCPPTGRSGPIIIGLNGQTSLGKPRHELERNQRYNYFVLGLRNLTQWLAKNRVQNSKHIPTTIGVPFNIGCGLAGGIWSDYERALNTFANELPSEWRVTIVKL
ncbi:hypothetical protein RCL1_001675 [Eukaryota sp. TZLM3-RCL]